MPYTLDQWRQLGRTFDYKDNSIFYVEAGKGVPLVVLHGFPTASWDWHYIWDDLAARYHVIAPDFLGFGFSDKPRNYAYSMLDQADMVEELLRAKGIEAYFLLTHDIGDTVGQELLARQLERGTNQIRAVCLLNGGLFPETHHALPIQKQLLGRWGWLISRLVNEKRFKQSLTNVFGKNTQPSPADFDAYWQLMNRKQGQRNLHLLIRYIAERRQHRERWVGALQQTPAPIRLIDGLDDSISGAHMVRRYRELIPNPDVVELPGIGHYPQTETPSEVLRAVVEFFGVG
jgi:pimeloyl-ACP methyl ester carboxylesterase